jgi:hypothetical protein
MVFYRQSQWQARYKFAAKTGTLPPKRRSGIQKPLPAAYAQTVFRETLEALEGGRQA